MVAHHDGLTVAGRAEGERPFQLQLRDISGLEAGDFLEGGVFVVACDLGPRAGRHLQRGVARAHHVLDLDRQGFTRLAAGQVDAQLTDLVRRQAAGHGLHHAIGQDIDDVVGGALLQLVPGGRPLGIGVAGLAAGVEQGLSGRLIHLDPGRAAPSAAATAAGRLRIGHHGREQKGCGDGRQTDAFDELEAVQGDVPRGA